MTALALHLPDRKGIARWSVAAFAILAAHAALVAALVLWYTRTPPEPNLIDAIAISFAPLTSAPKAPQQDNAVGVPQERVEETPPEPPQKVEPQVEQRVEKIEPPPPQAAEVTLPKPVSKPEKEPKPQIEYREKREERFAARSPAPHQSAVAVSQAYTKLVAGHARQFVRSDSAKYGTGVAEVHFVLNRQGQLISNSIRSSSGNAALDREARDTVRRANPFPPFPAEKSGAEDSFDWKLNFQRPSN